MMEYSSESTRVQYSSTGGWLRIRVLVVGFEYSSIRVLYSSGSTRDGVKYSVGVLEYSITVDFLVFNLCNISAIVVLFASMNNKLLLFQR